MAAFYLDNDVAPAIARHLRAFGHRAATTQGRRLGRAGDETQLLTAVQHGEILVTSNRRDFFLLHDAWLLWPPAWNVTPPPQHTGILIVPQAWPADVAAHELAAFAGGQALTNRLYWYRLGQGWLPRP